ncbi:TonB-dependent receptor [Kordiimonas pumila]|uniref:TonB-dependent receptor n=1 Tax=Kordiimonas pumila TaxID=2161677 RepID=A0ABV7D9B8_9PROT|nr:TonB-dependent receptor [Kordiimonas pumila]
MKNSYPRALFIAGIMAGTTLSTTTLAQDNTGFQLEEIIVTAQKRGQDIQNVPIAVSALSGAKIEQSGVRNATDLTKLVPGLQINQLFQASNPTIFLRGVGVNDFNAASSGAVGVTIDDVFLNSSVGALFQIYDIDRIEVLKGPQGTLYGRNTTGGVINFYTKQPTFEPDLSASVTYGRFNQLFLEAAGGGAVIDDTLAVRVSASVKQRDGWAINTIDGRDLNDIDNYATRLQLLFKPTDNITISNKIEGGRSETSDIAHKALGTFNVVEGRDCTGDEILAINICANPLTGFIPSADLSDMPTDILDNYERLDNLSDRLSIVYDGESISVTSITGYVRNHRRLSTDEDWSPYAIASGTLWDETSEQISEELRIASNAGGRLNWVVGAYFLHEKLDSLVDFTFLREFNPNPLEPYFDPANFIMYVERTFEQTTDSFAGFAQADYDVTDKLTLTAGIRYTNDKKDLTFRSVAFPVNADADRSLRPTEEPVIGLVDSNPHDPAIDGFVNTTDKLKKPTWRFAANYSFNDDISAYASYTRGVRSGGHNTGAVFEIEELSGVAPEQLDSFEIGMKSDLFDRHVRLNLAAFYYDYKDMQVFSLESNPDGAILQRLQNASAEIYGAEIELQARPLQGLDINFGLSALHAQYTKFDDPIRGDFAGQRLDKTPKLQMALGARYTFNVTDDAEAFLGGNFSYQSKVYFSPVNESPMQSSGHGELDLDAGISLLNTGVELHAFVKNVTDKRYIADMNDLASLGFYYTIYNEPRTYGLTLRYKM